MTTHSSSKSSLTRVLALASLLALASSPLSAQTNYNYDGGGTNTLWSNPTNWVGDTLPTFDTNAILSFNYTFPSASNILATAAGRTVRGLVFGADLTGASSFQIRTKTAVGGAGGGNTLTLNGGSANASIVVENITDTSLTTVQLGDNTGAVAFGSNVDLTNNSAVATLLFNNSVSGSGALNKYGIGAAAFNRSNTFAGGVNIYEGTVQAYANASALGTGTATLGAGNSSGNAVLAVGGAGGGAAVTYTNAITVGTGSGTRTVSNINTNVTAAVGNTVLSGAMTLNKDVIFDITQYTANTHDRITLSGAVGGSGGIVKSGTGLLILSNAANSFGGLQINAGQVTVQTNATVTGLSGSGGSLALSGGTLTVSASADSSFGQVISGAGALVKSGAGTLTLGGNNSYSGSTTVSAGSLIVNGNQSGATGVLTVAANAALGGSGTIGGPTTISGILAPGNSIGTLTVANDVTWNSGNSWVFELGAVAGPSILSPGSSDLLAITGGNDFLKGGVGPFTFDFAGTGDFGWYKLVDWAGGSTTFDVLDFTGVNLGGVYTSEFAIQDNALYVNVVPEPSTYALLALAAAGLGTHVVRRRRRSAR
jgi:fibronectin-binding autotransporter adhesin